jgi:thioester reductase-like protein
VWADAQQGRYDELQRYYRVYKSCLQSGCGIQDFAHDMAPTAVDYVARAIVYLATRHSEGGGIFHICAPTQQVRGVFERCNEVAGTALRLLPYCEWVGEIGRLHRQGRSLPVVPLLEYAFSMDEQTLREYERRIHSSNVSFDCGRTLRELEQAGIVAPVFNDKLLRLCIESMLARDADLQCAAEDPTERFVPGHEHVREDAWRQSLR